MGHYAKISIFGSLAYFLGAEPRLLCVLRCFAWGAIAPAVTSATAHFPYDVVH
jgi:hypothetical protein